MRYSTFRSILQFECDGISNVIYLTKQELYELGAARLALAEQEVTGSLQTDTLTLTLEQAHALSPPRCHLAPVEHSVDLMRLHNLGDLTGWTGVYKADKDAFDDRQQGLAVRREYWENLDGTALVDLAGSIWNPNQPGMWTSTSTLDIQNAVIFANGGLSTQSPLESLDGAFYQCCSLYAYENDTGRERGPADLADILVTLISTDP